MSHRSRESVRAFRRVLEFPAADLATSHRIPSGRLVVIDRIPDEDHLPLAVTQNRSLTSSSPRKHTAPEVAVQWGGLAPAD